jgi:hypothetical protein
MSSLQPCVGFSLFLYHLISLGPKYSSEHFVLKRPQSMFFLKNERPGFTPVQSKK